MADEAENARPKGLLIPFDKLKLLSILDDKAFREVFLAMAGYVQNGIEPDALEPIEQIAFESMRPFLNENVKTYQRAVLAHREAGRKGGRPKKTEDNHLVSDKNQMEPNGFSEKPTETNSPLKYKVQSTTDTNVSDITTVVVTQSSADVDLARIVQQYEAVIGTFPRSALDKLQGWRELYSTEMILLAIDRAAEANKRYWAYINGILSNWKREGVRTLGDVEASDENHKRQQARPGRSPRQPAESVDDQLTRVLANMDRKRGFEG
jgi:DnaD/phage-associated family protein